jgi:hypothetical protein
MHLVAVTGVALHSLDGTLHATRSCNIYRPRPASDAGELN